MAEPYIKLYRKMLDWEWYDDVNTKILFLHCLLKANWKSGSWHGIDYEAGQFITSLPTLAQELHLSIKQIRVALEHLKRTGEVADLRQGNSRIITILRWADYQGEGRPEGRLGADQGQTKGRLGAADKEYKEYKEGEEYNIQDFDPDIKNPDVMYKAICSFYNETCISMIKVKTLTENRMRILRDGLRVHTLDDYKELFRLADESKFLRGEVTNFKADFDWLIAPEHMTRILEGKYNERSDNGNNGTGDFEADEERRLRELDEYLASDEFRENDRSPFE